MRRSKGPLIHYNYSDGWTEGEGLRDILIYRLQSSASIPFRAIFLDFKAERILE
jgi:hypothetical protein